MVAATKRDISVWFDQGVEQGKSRMIIWCDSYDYEDYPEYSNLTGLDLQSYISTLDGDNMRRLMEIYDLTKPKRDQLNMRRVYNY